MNVLIIGLTNESLNYLALSLDAPLASFTGLIGMASLPGNSLKSGYNHLKVWHPEEGKYPYSMVFMLR